MDKDNENASLHAVQMKTIQEWGNNIMKVIESTVKGMNEKMSGIITRLDKLENKIEAHVSHSDDKFLTKEEGDRIIKSVDKLTDKVDENTKQNYANMIFMAKIIGGIMVLGFLASFILERVFT